MKTIIKLTVILCTTIIFFSCNNDDDTQPEQNIRLKAYSESANEYELNYNEDGTLKSYQYQSEGLLKTTIIYDDEGRIKQNGNTSYTYNNQGRVSKMTRRSGSRTIETTIVYNNEGLIASLTSRNETVGITTTSIFEYDSQNRIKSLTEESSGSFVKTSLVYGTNDNIEQMLIERSSDGVSYREYNVRNYTYDTKNNPNYNVLTKIGVSSTINVFRIKPSFKIGNVIAYEAVYFYSKNNLLSYQSLYSEGTVTRSYDYVYDENNYPTSAEIEYTDSFGPERNGTRYRTWTYENF